ncbi:MAG: hypothetical protein V2I43_27855 [Parvularcula sp.]|jgi:hypothetical protein|nr:hypothetical protein [Parvularcula sp.]
MKQLASLLVGIAAFLAAPASAADCTASDLRIRQLGDMSYRANEPPPQLQLELELVTDCHLRSLDIAPELPVFQFRSGSEVLPGRVIQVGAGSGGPSRYSLSSASIRDLMRGRTVLVDLMQFNRRAYVPAGVYSAQLRAVVNGESAPLFAAFIEVEPFVRFLGRASAGAFEVRLGELSQGARAQTQIVFLTNSALRLQVSSANGWQLRQREEPGLPPAGYDLWVSGRKVSGSQDISTSVRSNRSRLVRLPVRIEVPRPTSGLYSGEYTDIVTFDFTAE